MKKCPSCYAIVRELTTPMQPKPTVHAAVPTHAAPGPRYTSKQTVDLYGQLANPPSRREFHTRSVDPRAFLGT
jgi:hypothetical protein